MCNPVVRVLPDFSSQVRPVLLLLHAICLIQEDNLPKALESLWQAQYSTLTKVPASVLKLMLFELQGNYPEADAQLTSVIEQHYSDIVRIEKDIYIWLTIINVEQGIVALAQSKDTTLKAVANRVIILDGKSIERGYQAIAELAFRAERDYLLGDFETFLSFSSSVRKLYPKTKRLLAENMRAHLAKLKLKTGGQPVYYLDKLMEIVYSLAADNFNWKDRYIPVSVATIYYEWDEESIRSYRELIDYDHSVAEVEDLLLEGTKRFSW